MTRKEAVNDLIAIKELFEQKSGAYPASLEYAIEALKNEAEDIQQQWIPCSERNPEEEGEYLITLDFEWGREIEIGIWSDGVWFNDNSHVNVAWMPLIEPWRGTEK